MRRIKSLAITGALAAAFVLFASSRADAALKIYAQVGAGPIVEVGTAADFTGASFTGTVGGQFTVTIFGGSSNNGLAGGTLSNLLSSTTQVINNGAAGTLSLWVSQDNYTLPLGPTLSVESGLGGSISVPTLGLTNIFQAYADSGNALLGQSFTNGSQSAGLLGTTFDTGSAVGLFNRTGNYSLTSVARLVLGAGAIVNYSSHVNVTAIPEPGSMLLLGTGLLGLARAARRRMNRTA